MLAVQAEAEIHLDGFDRAYLVLWVAGIPRTVFLPRTARTSHGWLVDITQLEWATL
jgi:hypothetical protein